MKNLEQLFEEVFKETQLREGKHPEDKELKFFVKSALKEAKRLAKEYDRTPSGDFYLEIIDLLGTIMYNFRMNE